MKDCAMTIDIYESITTCVPEDIRTEIEQITASAAAQNPPVNIFFRADDIAVPSKRFHRLMELFLTYQTPLCLAVVPAWMTRLRWKAMRSYINRGSRLFCWHMHGYRHKNHEKTGKKQEFGPARPHRDLSSDLEKGDRRLSRILDTQLTRVFTPPWNRCSSETMLILQQMGYAGISRDHDARPGAPEGFPDFQIHVDLHTRKEKAVKTGWRKLFHELETGFSSKRCGIMIHHMRMDNRAFLFLEFLLALFSRSPGVKTLSYDDMIKKR